MIDWNHMFMLAYSRTLWTPIKTNILAWWGSHFTLNTSIHPGSRIERLLILSQTTRATPEMRLHVVHVRHIPYLGLLSRMYCQIFFILSCHPNIPETLPRNKYSQHRRSCKQNFFIALCNLCCWWQNYSMHTNIILWGRDSTPGSKNN